MDLLKAIVIFMFVVIAMVVGATLGVVLVPFAIVGAIYFVIKVVTFKEEI